MVACAVENNVPPAAAGATDRTGLTWIRVFRIDNGAEGADRRSAFVPVLCQHCGKDTPCVSVCPQQAVDVDPATGIVGQMPERCLGCRYCMAACPYHARYFNWWDPAWPAGMEKTLNPDVAPRMRGVVEKCNFCHGRWHAAKAKAVANGKTEIDAADYIPACVEACPSGAIRFGNLNDPATEAAQERAPAGQLPPAGIARHRPEDLLPLQEDLGARNRQRPAPGRKGERPWLIRWIRNSSRAVSGAAPRRASCCGSRPGLPCSLFGVYCAGLCLVKGLNQTNMDNRYAFGLWIFVDLTIIALGAGAFFTGFLLYILKFKELKAVINSAVVIGLVCYSGAMCALMVDVGQPLRAWFTFWYPNVHSMLTEVTFCISCYLTVLLIEYLPIVLKNRKLRDVPAIPGFRVRTAQADLRAGRRGHVPLVLPPGLARRPVRRAPRTSLRFPRRHSRVAFHLLPLHHFRRRGGPQLPHSHHLAGGEDHRQAPGERPRLRPAGPHLRHPAFRLRAGQDHRHADLDQPHVAGARLHRLAILRLEALRHVDSVRRDRALRPGARADPAHAAPAGAARAG